VTSVVAWPPPCREDGLSHQQRDGIWLIHDKGRGRRLDYDDIVDEALCFGWIDSKPGKVNDHQSKLWLAPRRPGSARSKRNKEGVERLSAAKSMAVDGRRAVEKGCEVV